MNAQTIELPIELDELRRLLRQYGIAKASVFGSYARGDAKPTSDLDLLVELAPGKNYFDLGGLQYALEERIPSGVDLVTKLNHNFEPYITPELVSIL